MAHEQKNDSRPDNGKGYEAEEANVRIVVLAGLGLVIGTVLVCLFVWGLFNLLKRNDEQAQTLNPMASPYRLPPEPRLEIAPWVERENLVRREQETLSTYGWVDRNSGKVRIPVERALDIMGQRGFPVRGGSSNAVAK